MYEVQRINNKIRIDNIANTIMVKIDLSMRIVNINRDSQINNNYFYYFIYFMIKSKI